MAAASKVVELLDKLNDLFPAIRPLGAVDLGIGRDVIILPVSECRRGRPGSN